MIIKFFLFDFISKLYCFGIVGTIQPRHDSHLFGTISQNVVAWNVGKFTPFVSDLESLQCANIKSVTIFGYVRVLHSNRSNWMKTIKIDGFEWKP